MQQDGDLGETGATGGSGARASREWLTAQRLYELALDYADRAHAAQADLVRAFEAEAAALATVIGEITVDDDDDERLQLGADGRFSGRIVDKESATWRSIGSADEVADHYDPVDLFTDLADVLAETYPGIDGSPEAGADEELAGSEPIRPVTTEPWMARSMGGGSEQLQALEDLRKAGVLSQAQFDAAKARIVGHG